MSAARIAPLAASLAFATGAAAQIPGGDEPAQAIDIPFPGSFRSPSPKGLLG
jgi:hypothetical protein